MTNRDSRGTVVLTGVGRRLGIGAGLALALAADGWDLVINYWPGYDERLGLERGGDDPGSIEKECRALGSRVELVPADLADPSAPARLVGIAAETGRLRALVMSHCESVDSSILDTSVESWDQHFAVNARATWLLVKAFAEHLPAEPTTEVLGSIVALTSDHYIHNLPYGASKGALDRIVLAAAGELGHRGIRANVINPGPIDTGWMDDPIRDAATERTPTGRLGTPSDTANLVRFLLSSEGGWINGQLLHSDGGFSLPPL